MKHLSYVVFVFFIVLPQISFGSPPLVSGVRLSDQQLNREPAKATTKSQFARAVDSESVELSYRLSNAGQTSVLICDLRGNIVRTLTNREQMNSGSHSLSWNGRDDDGDPCSGGVYVPVIETKSKHKGTGSYSATQEKWGGEVFAEHMSYNQGSLTFTLPKLAYGRVRIGIKGGGPIYITLASWQLFEEGSHSLDWDGKDVTGKVDLNNRDDLYLVFDGFALPENSIVLDGPVSLPAKEYSQFPLQPVNAAQPSYYALYTEPLLPEPSFQVALNSVKAGKKASFTVSLDADIPAVNLSETMVFIDHVFVAEHPTTQSPASISFDASNVPAGKHLLTINLITSDDRIASWSEYVTF